MIHAIALGMSMILAHLTEATLYRRHHGWARRGRIFMLHPETMIPILEAQFENLPATCREQPIEYVTVVDGRVRGCGRKTMNLETSEWVTNVAVMTATKRNGCPDPQMTPGTAGKRPEDDVVHPQLRRGAHDIRVLPGSTKAEKHQKCRRRI
jgi:hypothetical protein